MYTCQVFHLSIQVSYEVPHYFLLGPVLLVVMTLTTSCEGPRCCLSRQTLFPVRVQLHTPELHTVLAGPTGKLQNGTPSLTLFAAISWKLL